MCDMFEIWLIIGQQVIYDSLNLKPRIVYILKVFKLWNVKQKMYKLQTLPPQNVWFYNVSLFGWNKCNSVTGLLINWKNVVFSLTHIILIP